MCALRVFAFVLIIQNVFCQYSGKGVPNMGLPYAPYNSPIGNQGIPGYPGVQGLGMQPPMLEPFVPDYGGAGVGEVEVVGEMPVAGTTAVAGQVPVYGSVRFGGDIAAGGTISVFGGCGCGANLPFI